MVALDFNTVMHLASAQILVIIISKLKKQDMNL